MSKIKIFSKPFYASGGSDRLIYIWNTITKKKIFTSREYESSITNMIFSEDGKFLIFTCSYLFEDKFTDMSEAFFFNKSNNDLNFSFSEIGVNDTEKMKNPLLEDKLNKCEFNVEDNELFNKEISNKLYILKLK